MHAIQECDSTKVIDMLKDGADLEINHTFQYNDMQISPLFWAILSYPSDQQDYSIINAILDKGADLTYVDPSTGFNCLHICCHLTNE